MPAAAEHSPQPPHGLGRFRSSNKFLSSRFLPDPTGCVASTIMNERSGTRPEVIERQLAHKERNMVRRAYNHAEYLDERRQLMQWWSDYLDRCAAKAEKLGTGSLPLLFLALPSFLPLNRLALLGSTWRRTKQKAAKSKTYAAFKAVLGTTLQEFGRRYWNRTNDLHDVNVAL